MTLLLDRSAIERRRAVARAALAPLAASLGADLEPLSSGRDLYVPLEKARLTRGGGRCTRDGALLAFDPGEPHRHRCPRCGANYEDETHFRWWVMNYQLWLAERCAQAAVLWAMNGADRHRQLAERILQRLAERYLAYPNRDNVLGPTRPFFSTYLESIWLLQLSVALDVLETAGERTALGGAVRDRLIEPSAMLIASYHEGLSNRQVWNSAALAAAGTLLERPTVVADALDGPGGLTGMLAQGLLDDGTWYEGENYHLFAHRGLWYLATIAAARGVTITSSLVRRFDEGFVTPFLTALPDLTLPSRRDSPYRVSLRQWRIAESCELGLARRPDEVRLRGALRELYDERGPPADTARRFSTAEAERNEPGGRLTRADLGWKSLLFARETVECHAAPPAASVLLGGQGFGVLRRGDARTYVALDYGQAGGGHGHPDRLNLWLVDEGTRVLEDVGTGSYVDPSLHWYRSTLAHNAPLAGARSQERVNGSLRAWDEKGDAGWIDASAGIAPGVLVRRCVVAMEDYLVDVVSWSAEREVTIDLPWHVATEADGGGAGRSGVPNGDSRDEGAWRAADLDGGADVEDGFGFLRGTECGGPRERFALASGGVRGWVFADLPHQWWRAIAPGPPGSPPRRFHLVRVSGSSGAIVSVWAWRDAVRDARRDGDVLTVRLSGARRDVHQRQADGWRVEMVGAGGPVTRWLEGARAAASPPAGLPALEGRTVRRGTFAGPGTLAGPGTTEPKHGRVPDVAPLVIPRLAPAPSGVGELTEHSSGPDGETPLRLCLAGEAYRRSEASWEEAGSPEALVSLGATAADAVRRGERPQAGPVVRAGPSRQSARQRASGHQQ